MPAIVPFKAVHYNPQKVANLSNVVCPPYDVISKEQQDELYKLDPHNFIRLELIKDEAKDLTPLFDAIIQHIPPPAPGKETFFQMLVSNLDYSDYLGRIAYGRISSGRIRVGDSAVCMPPPTGLLKKALE